MELLYNVLQKIKDAGVSATVGFEEDHLTTIQKSLTHGYFEAQIVSFLIIIISLEHIVLLVKVVLSQMIGDKPNWVSKVERRTLY